ncbi:AAA family ATPase [Caryophanon latum]|uniref:Protein CR006 P-loop domain-containing protein n=1 Tax=Caryophanon latum TaxID=33977 RepID=A0A1C0YZQ6_9BACL|nr:AAA family ATPase [Caryophanon latum]OCS92677.1 hypothetical protein A6K76_06260 [Caryophanon latum]
MEKLNLKLQHCYGIDHLEHTFDFTKEKSVQIIYAPNGIMKTSLAKTFDDYSKGKESSDQLSPHLTTVRDIFDEQGEKISEESIFVIKSYEKSFKPTMVSTLLVNEELKSKYESVNEKIEAETKKLISNINKIAGLRNDTVVKFCESFDGDSFIEVLFSISEHLKEKSNEIYSDIKYNKIFDPKVVDLVKTKDFQDCIIDYITKYDDLVNNSKLFKKEFNHYNALTIQKQLKENGYFKANHSVVLNLSGEEQHFQDEASLLDAIQREQEEILGDAALKEIFDKIDQKLTTSTLREFRNLLLEKRFLVTELRDLEALKRKMWLSYILKNIEQYNLVIEEYEAGQDILNEVLLQAKQERTEWEKVIEIFNSRFYVPYKLEIENKADAIVKDKDPNIHYFFNNVTHHVEKEVLLQVLSQGEKRTFYLLNIIFEIESRRNKGLKTVLVVDDIADSFDYKNKYAIVEYLKDIASYENFYLIVLTHNFDFMRTVQDRISTSESKYHATFIAMKETDSIILENVPYKYICNPLKNWKRDLSDETKLIASITFARNLAEYIGDTANFKKLTSLLHLKDDTKHLRVRDIENIYKEIFKEIDTSKLTNKEETVYDIIIRSADMIATQHSQKVNLENKIVLSIAIRLKAEEYMIREINDDAFVSNIKDCQTGKLLGKYRDIPNKRNSSVDVLERVNIMTPENIHLNSFMFEPILDLSNDHLIKLYNDVNDLLNQVGCV